MSFVFIWLILLCLTLGVARWIQVIQGFRKGVKYHNAYFKAGRISEEEFKDRTSRLEAQKVTSQQDTFKVLLPTIIVIFSIGLFQRYYYAVDHCGQVFTPDSPEYMSEDEIESRQKYDTVKECISGYPYVFDGEGYAMF